MLFSLGSNEVAEVDHYRKAHARVSRNGKTSWITDAWVRGSKRQKSKKHKCKNRVGVCKKCGGSIETVRNNTGRILSYEVGMVSHGVLHHCFDIGRGLSKKRAEGVEDLFDWGRRKQHKSKPPTLPRRGLSISTSGGVSPHHHFTSPRERPPVS